MAAYAVDIVLLFAILFPVGWWIRQLIGWQPQTGPQVALAILWNFSLPVWLYFALSDASTGGATLGKRLFKIRVSDVQGRRVSLLQALVRTAIKLLPWELVHVSAFAISTTLAQVSAMQVMGLVVANLLAIVYLFTAVATRGRQSVHDFVARTMVVNSVSNPLSFDKP